MEIRFAKFYQDQGTIKNGEPVCRILSSNKEGETEHIIWSQQIYMKIFIWSFLIDVSRTKSELSFYVEHKGRKIANNIIEIGKEKEIDSIKAEFEDKIKYKANEEIAEKISEKLDTFKEEVDSILKEYV